MADNFTQGTVLPFLPATDHQLKVLDFLREMDCSMLDSEDIEAWTDEIETWGEQVVNDAREILGDQLDAYVGIDYEKNRDGRTYFYAEFSVNDTDAAYLQWLLQQMPKEIEYVVVEYAHTCSKMRPGEFGGGAWVIRRDRVDIVNSGSWSRMAAVGGPPSLEWTGGNDYILEEPTWIKVGDIAVRITKTDEGVICDMYANGVEDLDHAHLAACYAFDSDAKAAREGQGSNED